MHNRASHERDRLGAVAASLIVFVAFSAVLWRAGFLTFTGSDPSAKIVSAALALVGAFAATTVTLLGILWKLSYDHKTEHRLRVESERATAAAAEDERRLKLEAAIKAIQLFATPSGTPSLPIQRTGALFALGDLGHHDLALSLLRQLILTEGVEASAMAKVLDSALTSGEKAAQHSAINLMCDFPERLLTERGCEFPLSIYNGCERMPDYVREWAAEAMTHLLLARSVEDWRLRKAEVHSILAALSLMWLKESDDVLKNNLSVILASGLRLFPTHYLRHSSMKIDVSAIASATESATPSTTAFAELQTHVRAWSSSTAPPPNSR